MDNFIYSRHLRLFFGQRMLNEARAQDERKTIRNFRIGFRNTFDPVQDLSENGFRDIYRLTKDAFLCLCEELRNHTHLKSTQRISLETKVLTALLFYASGSYQRPLGVAKHLAQKMCSTYIEEVTQALIHPNIINKYIRFPQTAAERQSISHRFYIKYGMPGIIGSIDCSHFSIFGPPKEEEHLYFCRKQYYSINVQMICDSEYRILNVNPRFGGCNHDSFIWENSDVNPYMQSLHESGEIYWLLGDSGYPQRPWLMTPILDAVDGSPEALYNDKHAAARVVIENVFGRIKNRWRCLCKDRVLHYKPKKCAQIIQACSLLHNFFLNFQGPETDRNEDYRDDESSSHAETYREPPGSNTTDLIRGRSMRQQLVHRLHH